jgi:hypothetical protein
MSAYRCYRTDVGGQVIGVEVLEFSTDLEACAQAREVASNSKWDGFMLWQGDRRISCDQLRACP